MRHTSPPRSSSCGASAPASVSGPRRHSATARSRGELGFTLLELVIAMACVALVAGGIALSITTCINVWNRCAEVAELHQEARAVLELISRDLRGAYLGLDRHTGYVIEPGTGEGAQGGQVETIEMATHGNGLERFTLLPDELREAWEVEERPPLTDYMAVRYQWLGEAAEPRFSLQGTPEQVAGLYRVTSAVPFAGAMPAQGEEAPEEEVPPLSVELISTSVSGLRFEYYDGEEEEWVATWDSREAEGHPLLAVWMELTLKDAREREHVFETTVPIATY